MGWMTYMGYVIFSPLQEKEIGPVPTFHSSTCTTRDFQGSCPLGFEGVWPASTLIFDK